MALFIFLSFCLILEVHPRNVSQPQLVVSFTERGSVQLDCKTPSAGVSQCHFYPERDDKNTKLSPSCQLSLTDSELTWWTGRSYRSPEPLQSQSWGNETNTKLSPSCQLSLTDSELTRWTGRSYSSPDPVRVICYYTESLSGLNKPSPHSLPATVTVLDKKPAVSVSYDTQHEEFTAVCEIPLSGSGADFSCNLYTGHLQFLKGESRRGRSGTLSCSFTASKTDLLNRLQSVKSREVSCDYSLNSDPSVRSPMSDSYYILNLIPVPTPSSIPEEKSTAGSPVVPRSSTVTKMSTIATASSAALPVSTTATPSSTAQTQTTWHTSSQPQNSTIKRVTENASSEKHPTAGSTVPDQPFTFRTLLVVVLSVISVSAVLVGVVIFLCKKQRTDRCKVNSPSGDQGDMMAMFSVEECSSGAAGLYSLITTVPAPSKPSGSTIPIQNWDDSDPQAATYSEITSTAAPLEPPGPSKKRKENSEKPETDVYHTYSTIPDIPVASKQNDSVYSLIKM
ncbi:hypothetical protein MHYP_G00266090 [Metynnis hypsauchen]